MFDALSSIDWREPRWLLLMITPIVIWIGKYCLETSKNRYADLHLSPWAIIPHPTSKLRRFASKTTVYILVWILFAIVAAGPRYVIEPSRPQQSTDMDIMLVLDVSRSMRATDIFPSRLQRAHIEIEEFLERAVGKRVGVIVFAARPHVLAPLTSDHAALRFYLESLNNIQLPTLGSVPELAITLARNELKSSIKPTAIVLISDGDFFPKNVNTAKEENKTPIYVLGIGGKEGEAIQLENGQWLKYKDQQVITALKEKTLIDIAYSGQRNHYIRAQQDDSDWQFIYDDGIVAQRTKSQSSTAVVEPDDRVAWQQLYHGPLFFSIFLLWFSLVPYRLRWKGIVRRVKKRFLPLAKYSLLAVVRGKFQSLALVCLTLSLVVTHQERAWAASSTDISVTGLVSDRQAYKKYINGNFVEALKIYQKNPGFNARIGAGSSHYKLKNYNAAIRQFSKAVLVAEQDSDRAVALYNLANSYFKIGDYVTAVLVYRDVLRYRPEDKHTLHNLKLSMDLKTAVEERVDQNERQARVGNGPRFRDGESDESISSAGSISLSENPGVVSNSTIDLTIYNLNEITLNELIKNGLSKVRLANENTTVANSRDTRIKTINRINVNLSNMTYSENQSLLWKRLFEMEEGFPAPLDEARALPEIPPW